MQSAIRNSFDRSCAAVNAARAQPAASLAILAIVILAMTIVSGCSSTPAEAPELSAQLGGRITAMEGAHRRLLADYFQEKRRQIDEFVQEEWVPVFTREFFEDPAIAATWEEVVKSDDPEDRLKFLQIAGPKLQTRINARRIALIQPIDELEIAVQGRLADEYNSMRAINGTLTAFLQSASEVDANRKRYLDMLGVDDSELSSFIDDADAAVSDLVKETDDVDARIRNAQSFATQIKEIIKEVNN